MFRRIGTTFETPIGDAAKTADHHAASALAIDRMKQGKQHVRVGSEPLCAGGIGSSPLRRHARFRWRSLTLASSTLFLDEHERGIEHYGALSRLTTRQGS
ncbi:hypothetical protein [Mesorhizobium abyssinicae]|uniref:hypothetical protein n=1 Tax=Mesorhizobium abyssinicae TaxID=1209958 RepID=UPI003CF1FFDB